LACIFRHTEVVAFVVTP
jgi:hypothetical protein